MGPDHIDALESVYDLYFRLNFSDYPSHLVHHIHRLCEVIEETVKQLRPVWWKREIRILGTFGPGLKCDIGGSTE